MKNTDPRGISVFAVMFLLVGLQVIVVADEENVQDTTEASTCEITDTYLGDRGGSIVYSADGRHVACVVQHARREFAVAFDGKEDSLRFQWIPSAPVISPDGKRVAYPGFCDNKKFVVVVDGKARLESDGSVSREWWGDIKFSPDSKHVVYVVTDHKSSEKRKAWAVLDDKKLADADSLPVFSPDSARMAYVIRPGMRRMFVDGKEGKAYDDIVYDEITPYADFVVPGGKLHSPGPGPIFSPDSKHVAYIARLGDKWFVVVDEKESQGYDNLPYDLIFSPNSERVAYRVWHGEERFVVVDGKEGKRYNSGNIQRDPQGIDRIVFSPDSKRIAYIAQSAGKFVVVWTEKRARNTATLYNILFSAPIPSGLSTLPN